MHAWRRGYYPIMSALPITVVETQAFIAASKGCMTEAELLELANAAIFGISQKTVRNWEQGIRHPESPARVLLQVIEREPEAVLRALR